MGVADIFVLQNKRGTLYTVYVLQKTRKVNVQLFCRTPVAAFYRCLLLSVWVIFELFFKFVVDIFSFANARMFTRYIKKLC